MELKDFWAGQVVEMTNERQRGERWIVTTVRYPFVHVSKLESSSTGEEMINPMGGSVYPEDIRHLPERRKTRSEMREALERFSTNVHPLSPEIITIFMQNYRRRRLKG